MHDSDAGVHDDRQAARLGTRGGFLTPYPCLEPQHLRRDRRSFIRDLGRDLAAAKDVHDIDPDRYFGERSIRALAQHFGFARIDRNDTIAGSEQLAKDAVRGPLRVRRGADHGDGARLRQYLAQRLVGGVFVRHPPSLPRHIARRQILFAYGILGIVTAVSPEDPRARPRILVIDDDESTRRTLRLCLEAADYAVSLATSGETGLALAKRRPPDLALVDLRLGGIDGLAVTRALALEAPAAQVIVMTAYATVDNAVDAMRSGARDYLAKPFTPAVLKHVVARVLEAARLREELAELGRQRRRSLLQSASAAVQAAYTLAERVAPSGAAVLIQGESGTGKSVLARHIHASSERSSRPFVTVNCATISRESIESELFGHAQGAIGSSDPAHAGHVEAARNGTLFIDEVSHLGKETQGKLVRLLEEREYVRVGDSEPRRADARILAATPTDLKALVTSGAFREDLFYRLSAVTIRLPPLRERREDIPALVNGLLAAPNLSAHTKPMTASEEARAALIAYDWPGNLRELSNVLERAALLANGDIVTPDLLPEEVRASSRSVLPLSDEDESLEAAERRHIALVVARHPTLDSAAKALGVDPSTLYRKRERYGLR